MSVSSRKSLSRQSLLEEKLRSRVKSAQARRIQRIPVDSGPLSAAQERIWLLYEFDPSSPAFNRPLALRLKGSLDPASVQGTIDEILRRHEALRTVFPLENGEPVQRILPSAPASFERIKIDPSCSDAAAAARRIAAAEAARLFDLHRGPLFHAKLLELDRSDHVLLILMHHIVFDGWSENVFHREFATIYDSFARGESAGIPAPEIQYVDFARWQQERLAAGAIQPSVDYWSRELSGLPSSLQLPPDDTASGPGVDGARVTLRLDGGLKESLENVCHENRASFFMLLLGVFQLVLARYSGQRDVVVGCPVAGRSRVETEALIGCFMNVLVFRTKLPKDLDFRGLLRAVRQTTLRGFEHQDAPFEKVVAALAPERVPGRWPLFQAMFHFRNLPNRADLDQESIRIERFDFDSGVIGGLDLSLEVKEQQSGLHCSLSYDSARFGRGTIERILQSYQSLLEVAVVDPGMPLWQAPIISEEQRHREIYRLNQTVSHFSSSQLIHELVAKQTVRTPNAVAVIAGEERWTYQYMMQCSSHVARRTARLGGGSGSVVGICMQRSPWLAAAVLGVLESGAAYAPLDFASPPDRLRGLVEDAEISIVVADPTSAPALRGVDCTLLVLDPNSEEPAEPAEAPRSEVTPADPCYLIYTSGSTGKPKGVLVSHRSVCNHLLWRKEFFPLKESDRQLQRASLTFDDSVWELFEPWTCGACVVMAASGREPDGAYLIDLIREQRITSACFIPSQLAALVEENKLETCQSLRRITTGGETLPVSVAARVREVLPGARLFNGYGPTEATVACCYHECTGDPTLRTVPIGRPIANMEAYVLDDFLQPLLAGAIGELYIAGAGLAIGYLNRPAETAARFLPHPFRPGSRVYRTGDLARRLTDGQLEFIGRRDHQVKIRGYRIELGEIEAALQRHDGVSQAVVDVWSPQAGDSALAAYVVLAQPDSTTTPALKDFLKARLPSHMIPSDWLLLEELPRTVSGKVNREALPDPPRSGQRMHTSPRTRVEASLVRIWEEALQVRNVGVRQDFFALGGHSLLAVRVFALIHREFGVQLPLAALFEAPTIEALAALIEGKGAQASWASLVPIRSSGSRPPLFCPHANGGDVLFYRELAEELGPDQSFYALRSPGLSGKLDPPDTVEEYARFLLEEIRSVQPQGPYHLAGFCIGAYLAFEMARQLTEANEQVAFLGVIDTDGEWKLLNSPDNSLRYHLRSIAGRSIRSKAEYIHSRLRFRARRTADLAAQWATALVRRTGWAAPPALLRRHLRARHMLASRRYKPQPYQGAVKYFEGDGHTGRDFRRFWGPLVQGGLNSISIPGQGIEVLSKPAVRVLAARLNDSLSFASFGRRTDIIERSRI